LVDEKVKPCPECGSTDRRVEVLEDDPESRPGKAWIVLRCHGCGYTISAPAKMHKPRVGGPGA